MFQDTLDRNKDLMRDKLRALYYPDFWVNYPTLIKCILLFDEIHFMDRPSLTFDGRSLTIGMASPIRQHEKWFREQGVPLYVHQPPSGPVGDKLRKVVEADLSDSNFMTRFQEGLRTSSHFRNVHIQPGDYGNNETHETIFQKLSAIELGQSPPLLEVHNDPNIRPFDFGTPEGCLKTLVSAAAFCSAKINFALEVGLTQAFSPLADMSPYARLLGAKYARAIASESSGSNQIPLTDLSLTILDELLPAENLTKITVDEAIKYRRESETAREAFLEHLLALQAKLGHVPADGDYATAINKIITTEVRPAARGFRDKLDTIYEKLFGKIAGAALAAAGSAITWAGSSAVVQILGDITWQKLLAFPIAAAAYVGPKAIDALVESRAVSRECALSYLLDLEA